jgi:hypothetical protein
MSEDGAATAPFPSRHWILICLLRFTRSGGLRSAFPTAKLKSNQTIGQLNHLLAAGESKEREASNLPDETMLLLKRRRPASATFIY